VIDLPTTFAQGGIESYMIAGTSDNLEVYLVDPASPLATMNQKDI